MSSVPDNGPWERAGAAQDPLQLGFLAGMGKAHASGWLPSITAENQYDHACNLLPDPQRERNTLQFVITSKLAGDTDSFSL